MTVTTSSAQSATIPTAIEKMEKEMEARREEIALMIEKVEREKLETSVNTLIDFINSQDPATIDFHLAKEKVRECAISLELFKPPVRSTDEERNLKMAETLAGKQVLEEFGVARTPSKNSVELKLIERRRAMNARKQELIPIKLEEILGNKEK